MNTTNINILRSFYSVTNRNELTEEIYQILLKRWGFENININDEMMKINAKQSNLTKSRRDAIPEFIKLRSMLDQKKQAEMDKYVMNAETNNDENILIGNDFSNDEITNQEQVESVAEIN